MPIAPQPFWRSTSQANPPLTDSMVVAAELELGVPLPPEYVSLLKVQNGGYTIGFGFPTTQPTSWAADHVPLRDVAGIVTGPGPAVTHDILESAYMTKEWGLPQGQAILSGDGHWWITLDYRKGEIPSVAWIDVECGQDIQLAPTFAAFLQGLRLISEYDPG